jgi:hypothetical protein
MLLAEGKQQNVCRDCAHVYLRRERAKIGSISGVGNTILAVVETF